MTTKIAVTEILRVVFSEVFVVSVF
jgi:hypothetical protein